MEADKPKSKGSSFRRVLQKWKRKLFPSEDKHPPTPDIQHVPALSKGPPNPQSSGGHHPHTGAHANEATPPELQCISASTLVSAPSALPNTIADALGVLIGEVDGELGETRTVQLNMKNRLQLVKSLLEMMPGQTTAIPGAPAGAGAMDSMTTRLTKEQERVKADLAAVEDRLEVLLFARKEWQSMLNMMKGVSVDASSAGPLQALVFKDTMARINTFQEQRLASRPDTMPQLTSSASVAYPTQLQTTAPNLGLMETASVPFPPSRPPTHMQQQHPDPHTGPSRLNTVHSVAAYPSQLPPAKAPATSQASAPVKEASTASYNAMHTPATPGNALPQRPPLHSPISNLHTPPAAAPKPPLPNPHTPTPKPAPAPALPAQHTPNPGTPMPWPSPPPRSQHTVYANASSQAAQQHAVCGSSEEDDFISADNASQATTTLSNTSFRKKRTNLPPTAPAPPAPPTTYTRPPSQPAPNEAAPSDPAPFHSRRPSTDSLVAKQSAVAAGTTPHTRAAAVPATHYTTPHMPHPTLTGTSSFRGPLPSVVVPEAPMRVQMPLHVLHMPACIMPGASGAWDTMDSQTIVSNCLTAARSVIYSSRMSMAQSRARRPGNRRGNSRGAITQQQRRPQQQDVHSVAEQEQLEQSGQLTAGQGSLGSMAAPRKGGARGRGGELTQEEETVLVSCLLAVKNKPGVRPPQDQPPCDEESQVCNASPPESNALVRTTRGGDDNHIGYDIYDGDGDRNCDGNNGSGGGDGGTEAGSDDYDDDDDDDWDEYSDEDEDEDGESTGGLGFFEVAKPSNSKERHTTNTSEGSSVTGSCAAPGRPMTSMIGLLSGGSSSNQQGANNSSSTISSSQHHAFAHHKHHQHRAGTHTHNSQDSSTATSGTAGAPTTTTTTTTTTATTTAATLQRVRRMSMKAVPAPVSKVANEMFTPRHT